MAAAIACCALLGSTAGSALATVPAFWAQGSPAGWGGAMEMKGSLTIKRSGTNAKSCTVEWAPAGGGWQDAYNSEGHGGYLMFSGFTTEEKVECGAADLYMTINGEANYNAGYTLTNFENLNAHGTPYGGTYMPLAFTVPFTNGVTGKTASIITFSNTLLGNEGSAPITATGTLNVTDGAGGLRSLGH